MTVLVVGEVGVAGVVADGSVVETPEPGVSEVFGASVVTTGVLGVSTGTSFVTVSVFSFATAILVFSLVRRLAETTAGDKISS